jgi:hypothetical protein
MPVFHSIFLSLISLIYTIGRATITSQHCFGTKGGDNYENGLPTARLLVNMVLLIFSAQVYSVLLPCAAFPGCLSKASLL